MVTAFNLLTGHRLVQGHTICFPVIFKMKIDFFKKHLTAFQRVYFHATIPAEFSTFTFLQHEAKEKQEIRNVDVTQGGFKGNSSYSKVFMLYNQTDVFNYSGSVQGEAGNAEVTM